MLLRSTDRLFLAFCRNGDPGALGKVFDRTAPELLRVALYLSGDRDDAEDLLQRTFLSAIESRGKYDSKRRALPWLLGILSNHGRRLQRERATRRRDVATSAERSDDDPQAAASNRELGEQLLRLRAELGAPYAEVLELHLEQGLNAKEIATKLGRPAGTVRTQLMRGRELLQKHLPTGYVAALLPVAPPLTDAAGLAAIKAHVLASAGDAAGVATATAAATTTTIATAKLATGGLLMSKKLLFAIPAALLLLAAGIYARWTSATETAPDAPGVIEAARDDSTLPVADRGATPAGAANAAQSTPAREAAVAAVANDPGFGALRVEVRWQNGDPAEHVGVGAEGLGLARNERRLAVTDGDGTCVLRHLRPGSWRISTTHTDGHSDVDVVAGPPGLCRFTANATITAGGRVVDDHDRPVADADVWIAPKETRQWWRFRLTKSDQQGRFELRLARRAYVGAAKAGFATSFAAFVDPDETRAEIVLRLRGRGSRIEGTVRDERGRPVAWARVHAGPTYTMNRSLNGPYEDELHTPAGPETLTDADGRYTIHGVEHGREVVQAWAPGYSSVQRVLEVDAAVIVCDLTLAIGAVVHGHVRTESGEPIANADVYPSWAHGWFVTCRTHTDASGHYRLIDLPIGNQGLHVRAAEGRDSATFELTSGAVIEWNPELRQTTAIRGQVLDVDGLPMVDVLVAVTTGGEVIGGPVDETDERGVFELQPTESGPIELRVGDLSQPALRFVHGVPTGTDDLVIRLTVYDVPSAVLRGRVVDENGRPLTATIGARRPRAVQGYTDETAADGTFALGPVAAGRLRMQVLSPNHGSMVLPDATLQPDEERDLGDIVMKTPGSAIIDVLDEQGQPARSFVSLYTHGGGWVASARTDQGRAKFAALQPGRYFVTCGGMPFSGSAELDVQPAAESIAKVQLRRVGHADLIVDDPREVANLDLKAFAFAHSGSGPERGAFLGMFGNMQGERRLRLWLAPGRYRIEVHARDGRRTSADVTIRDLGHHPEVTAVLPKQ